MMRKIFGRADLHHALPEASTALTRFRFRFVSIRIVGLRNPDPGFLENDMDQIHKRDPSTPSMREILGIIPINICLKVVSISLIFLAAPFLWADTFLHIINVQNDLPSSVSFGKFYYLNLLSFFLAIFAIAITPFLRFVWMRFLGAVFISAGFIYDRTLHALEAVTQEDRIEYYDVLKLAWQQRANTFDAVAAYGPASYIYVIMCSFYIVCAILPASKRYSFSNYFSISLPASILIAAYVAIQPYSQNRYYFPSSVHVPVYIYRIATMEIDYSGPRREPAMQPVAEASVSNIILIVDESVRADFLSLNNPVLDSTPTLTRLADESGVNYGTSMAIANCSVASRHGLRTGLRQEDLPDVDRDVFHRSTFWQYAKQSGFTTYYLDPFRQQFAYHSFMNENEARQIDHRYSFVQNYSTIDLEVAAKLNAIMEDDGRNFIFVEKYGAHFPHDGRYLPSGFEYEPSGISELPRDYDDPQSESIRQYLRSLRWMTDGFFDEIEALASRPDTVVIYTADHGQNLFDAAPWLQHCNSSERFTAIGEAAVPLVVLTGSPALKAELEAVQPQWYDKTSMEDIFPTLLRMMGYEPADVQAHYGPSLFDTPPDRQRQFIMRDLDTGRLMDFDQNHK